MKIREFDVSFSIFGPETPSLLSHFCDPLIFEIFNQITITISLNYTITSQNTHAMHFPKNLKQTTFPNWHKHQQTQYLYQNHYTLWNDLMTYNHPIKHNILIIKNYIPGSAIRCFECNSNNDTRCAEDIPPGDLAIECGDHQRGVKYIFCRKIKQLIEFSVNNCKTSLFCLQIIVLI